MRRRDRQAIHVGGGDQLGRDALAIGQMLLADLLADGATMRFQPIIAPSPSAMATAIFTQSGMNFVALSI